MSTALLPNSEPIPGYRLLERLGRGGYGEVWKAEAPGGMHKAIKFVFGDVDAGGEDNAAAEQEFRSLNRVKTIRHPFILSLERIEVIDGQLVIVTELADKNLWDRCTECTESGLPGIPREELLGYLEEAAEALDLMNFHHQIQHLDVKPQNLFLVHRHIKVADFGLAKDLEGSRASMTGGITPMYAPPETFEGWVSRQSDQYSLSIVYMEMLTGRRPFNGTTSRQMILQHLAAAPDLSPLSSPEREAVARALSKVPDQRFSTCADFVRALQGLSPLDGRSVPIDVPTEPLDPDADSDSAEDYATQRIVRTRSKSLPALVTPKSKIWNTSGSKARQWSPVRTLSAPKRAPSERKGEGVLFPALIVGTGGAGLGVMQALRQVLGERFGRPSLPHLRWLFIDTDPATIQQAQSVGPGKSLSSDEVLLTNISRPTHYLSREGLPPVDTWLPSEELFRIPRTPVTDGVRKIGRLALCDHYHVVRHRIKIALEAFLNNSGLEEVERITGLGVRSSFPRVYLATSLVGGTVSGMFLDLSYLIRRELVQMGFARPRVTGLLLVPSIGSEPREARGLINTRAALTELNYYSQPGVNYETVFDTREGPIEDPDPPFERCTLIRQLSFSDKDSAATSFSHAAHITYAELLTPIGQITCRDDETSPKNLFHVVGLQRVNWPRPYVLKAASRTLVSRILSDWLNKTAQGDKTVPVTAIDAQWGDRRLARVALRSALKTHVHAALGVETEQRILECLGSIPDRTDSQGPDVVRLRKVLRQLIELVGQPGSDEVDRAEAVGKALATGTHELSAQIDARLRGVVFSLIEQPGQRLAAAEEAIRILRTRLDKESSLAEQQWKSRDEQATALFAPIHQHLLLAGAEHATRGSRNWATLAEALTALGIWATARLQAQIAGACARVYRVLLGNLPEYVREVNLVRSQLSAFLSGIGTAESVVLPSDGIFRPVFPNGARTVTGAALELIENLSQPDVTEFEHALQARIRHECRGLMGVCSRSRELGPGFVALLKDQAVRFLDSRLPHLSASNLIDLNSEEQGGEEDHITDIISAATPTGLGQGPPNLTVIASPDDPAPLEAIIRRLCPGNTVVVAPSSDDLIIWRECRGLTLNSFPHLFSSLASGEEHLTASAYSRNDVSWEATVVG